MIFAIVPVKDLRGAKKRLAGALSPAQRQGLCLAMLADVLAALRAARRLDGIVVNSGDERALAMAGDFGLFTVRERLEQGQSAAVSEAIPLCIDQEASRVLTIPLDAPLLTGDEIDSLIAYADAERLPNPSAVLVPSRDGTGTNALLLAPPSALSPSFGPDSLARHTAAAVRQGIACRQFPLPRLGLDVDTPADLAALADVLAQEPNAAPETARYLVQNGLLDRDSHNHAIATPKGSS